MSAQRKNAVIVGLLFIIATAFLFIGQAVYKPILSAPDYLEITYPNRTTVIVGVLLEFVIVLAMPLIAVIAFPILKRHNEALAIGYVVFRALEGVILITVAETNKLALIGVSEAYLQGGADATYFEAIGTSIQAATYWGDTGGLLYVLLFAFGGLMLYTILYQSRLIPRWLSAWGWIAIVMILSGALLSPFMEFTLVMELVAVIPIALQEMVMALWLIVKGWNPEAVESSATVAEFGRIAMSGTI
ncbi:MAG: DUF4386 domain-containing protein [Caldilineaceae bacterium]|nr:DUF4386 domain-containing protein [Caldilineaceae bacterium]